MSEKSKVVIYLLSNVRQFDSYMEYNVFLFSLQMNHHFSNQNVSLFSFLQSNLIWLIKIMKLILNVKYQNSQTEFEFEQ